MENRGILYPERLPTFHRVPPPAAVADWVRWFWIPEWDIAAGKVHRQHLIGYPACNLVVEADLLGISGPTTRASYRDLSGTGWAVGALLRPAAVPGLVGDPADVRDDHRAVDLPDLGCAVAAAMRERTADDHHHAAAVAAFSDWLAATLPPTSPDGVLANAMVDLIDRDEAVLQVSDAADALGVSVRTLQRLARTHVGVTPAAMIRRRRLQGAAERVREQPGIDLATLAAELGYADHAHLTRDFRTVLGFTPTGYRHEIDAR